MYITIINDCHDSNASGRQATRVLSLFGVNPVFISVNSSLSNSAELEASGNIIDSLDAAGDIEGIVLSNVSPRSGNGKQWSNGAPFGFFKYENTTVFSSVSGLSLSLVKKLKLTDSFFIIDLDKSIEKVLADGLISKELSDRIISSQFRSFDFLPRIAFWQSRGFVPVGQEKSINEFEDCPKAIWAIDNFGNCKTTLLADEIEEETRWGNIKKYKGLKDVPEGELGFIIGSSGLEEKRFAEIILQGGSASKKLGIKNGELIN